MVSEDTEKKPTNPFSVLLGIAVGAMPAMLQLPFLGKIMFWLLGNFYFLLFYLFMVYLPWMMGSILSRVVGYQHLVPTIFCMFYWTILGSLMGSPKHAKKAWFYVGIAHFFIPMIFVLNAIGRGRAEDFSMDSIFNLVQVFSAMFGQ